MRELFRLLGALLLMCAGMGWGFAVSRHQYEIWRQLHALDRLFTYLHALLQYQALSGAELLRRAALYPEFARIGVQRCNRLADLPLSDHLPSPLRQEITQELAQIGLEPRTTACATLQRLHTLCESAAAMQQEKADLARHLWPRLGACLGILLAILLW